jgi:hypothetical protein
MSKSPKTALASVYYDGTGYACVGIDSALALDAVGHDVVPINVKLASQTIEPPSRIKELMQKSRQGCDVLVQHILSPYWVYQGGAKNIGYVHWETDNMSPSNWQFHCNLMDLIWVSSQENADALKRGGVKKPIKVVPIPCNAAKYVPGDILDLGHNKNRYKFYHIGDYSARKNVVTLIKSYLQEFSKADNVVLILKVYVEAVSPQESAKIISDDIQRIKMELRKSRIDNFAPIIVIPEYLSPEQILQVHRTCDCFVSAEKGSAWTLPAFDAAALGKWCICNKSGGHTQYLVDQRNAWLMDYELEPCSGMEKCPYSTLYTCHENWAAPSIADLRLFMRSAYKDRPRPTASAVSELIEKYRYENAGKDLLEALNA